MSLVMHLVSTRKINHSATGMRFRQKRQSLQISLRALARAMKLSAPYVGDLELGKRNWTEERARDYEAALKLVKNRGF